ncbi:MAG: hypothetical protein EOO45_20720 [Flavobacterium sp.]|nr:MAG: hypothetical protein EOO45_20720 [Flavobacterium sp.]
MTFNRFTKGAAALLLFSTVLVSCNKETKSEPSTVGVVPPTSNPAFQNLDGAPQPAVTATNADPAASSAAPSTTAPGMNPPHGQPGHRCEIAVGAPLNSQPAAKPAQAPVQAPQMAPAAVQPQAPVATAPGMNPPHGQPGHTCSVAVGAPLPK